MAARHGTISPTLRAGVPFLGGAEGGGGGAGGCCVHPPSWGGVAGGSSVRRGRETRWRPLGSWAPSRKNLGFAGGDSATLNFRYPRPSTLGTPPLNFRYPPPSTLCTPPLNFMYLPPQL